MLGFESGSYALYIGKPCNLHLRIIQLVDESLDCQCTQGNLPWNLLCPGRAGVTVNSGTQFLALPHTPLRKPGEYLAVFPPVVCAINREP